MMREMNQIPCHGQFSSFDGVFFIRSSMKVTGAARSLAVLIRTSKYVGPWI